MFDIRFQLNRFFDPWMVDQTFRIFQQYMWVILGFMVVATVGIVLWRRIT